MGVPQVVEPLRTTIAAQPYPLLFATLSGAHLYGFPSPDSDYDLRGVHVLPLAEVIGLETGPETVEYLGAYEGLELDLVTHDARKSFRLMLKRNGYVLEQLLSPLVVHITPEHEELKALAPSCITRHHGRHYLGFARKLAGPERSGLDGFDMAFHEREYERLSQQLEVEMAASRLPETASAKRALNELLIRVRRASLDGIGECAND